MVKLVTSVILFSFLLTVSYARFSLDHPENEEIVPDLEPLSGSATDLESYIVDSKWVSEQDKTVEPEITESTETVPLTVISFRPINRNFPLRHRHNCRHGRRQINPSVGPREIPYGNDMILSRENYLPMDPAVRGNFLGEIPARWPKFNKHDDEDERHHHPHHFRHPFMSHFRRHDHEMGGFLSKIRKFLGQAV